MNKPTSRSAAATRPQRSGTVRKAASPAKRAPAAPKADTQAVRITHPERIVYPGTAITKQDVADYYRTVMDRLLPELAGRPLSVIRCPDGAGSACFFQKHHADKLGAHVASILLREKDGGSDRYLYVEDARGVLELVQMNALEFHPWGSRVDDPEKPDRLVFDLDPAPGVGWNDLISAAKDVRARLSKHGLESFPRLSGGKGVHVVAAIRRGPTWDQAKAFCESIADEMAADDPSRYLATASKAQREGRIFIDWLRNARGATSVASWSLRARAGAPVAMPLRWDELAKVKSPTAFDLAAALKRAKALRKDPWEGFAATKQSLPRASSRR
jgi:bifunctional non-homologous end joining protein LigD